MSAYYITIDSIEYQVPIVGIQISADALDKYAERTNDGVLHREMIGMYFNYQVEFGASSLANFALLWDKLTEPVEFHTVTLMDDGGSFTFTAYISGVKADIRRVRAGSPLWKGLVANFIAKQPART